MFLPAGHKGTPTWYHLNFKVCQPVVVKCYLILLYLYDTDSNDGEHIFICCVFLCLLLSQIPVCTFAHFLPDFFFLFLVVCFFYYSYIFWILIFISYMCCRYFLSVCDMFTLSRAFYVLSAAIIYLRKTPLFKITHWDSVNYLYCSFPNFPVGLQVVVYSRKTWHPCEWR